MISKSGIESICVIKLDNFFQGSENTSEGIQSLYL